ncbi:VWA domain-containing protein [Myxococcota bacterium]|nr:VWA domain-containing protein [Myxococcota bacterium]
MTQHKLHHTPTKPPTSPVLAPSATWVMIGVLFALLCPLSLLLDFHTQVARFLLPEIHLARAWVLALLWLLPAIGLFLQQARRARMQRLSQMASPLTLQSLLRHYSPGRIRLKGWLLAMGSAFFLIAWAGPQWGTRVRLIQRKGIDVVVAIDVSESMLARDIPSATGQRKQRRLDLARRKVRYLMDALAGERIGIVAFSGKPVTLCPLTSDYNTCALWLDDFDPSLIPYSGTALASSLQHAIPMFATSGMNSRALFLITDGDDHEKNTLQAAKEAKKQGIRIYALGIGSTEEVTLDPRDLPPPPAGQAPDPRPIVTRLNEKLLQQIAQETTGLYRHAEASQRDIRQLFEHATQTLEARTQKSRRQVFREERFPLFLGLGLLLLLVDISLRERRS